MPPKIFTFDYSYQSHDGFELDDEGISVPAAGSNYASQRMVFNDLGQGVLNNAFEGMIFNQYCSWWCDSIIAAHYSERQGIVIVHRNIIYMHHEINDTHN